MSDSLVDAELADIEPTVSSSLMPNETLLRLCKLTYRRYPWLNMISLGTFYACIDIAITIDLDGKIVFATWWQMLTSYASTVLFVILIQAILSGFLTVLWLANKSWTVEPFYFPYAIGFILLQVAAVVAAHIWALIVGQKALAITNERIIYLTLPKGKIRGWLNLDNLGAVEIQNNALKLKFTGLPIGMAGKPIPIGKEVYLRNIEHPDQIKTLMDEAIRS